MPNDEHILKPTGRTFYNEIGTTLSALTELTGRIDERVKTINDRQAGIEYRIESCLTQYQSVAERLAVIESERQDYKKALDLLDRTSDRLNGIDNRLNAVEGSSDRTSDKVKTFVNFGVQLLWVVVAGFILYKLHLQAPP